MGFSIGNKIARTHGESNPRSAEFRTWLGMRDRCTNPNASNWYKYGGRGIKVCNRWLNDYSSFLEDMGRKPTPKHSLDRIDNEGNYDPSNCKWSTIKEQNRNQVRGKNGKFLAKYVDHGGTDDEVR